MNETPIGKDLGSDAVEEMRAVTARFWTEWGSRYNAMSEDRKNHMQRKLNLLLQQAMGTAVCNHALAWERFDDDPSAVGLARPVPSTSQQFDSNGVCLALWGKIGDGDRDWVKLWPQTGGGGSGGGPAPAPVPEPDPTHDPDTPTVVPGAFLYPGMSPDSKLRKLCKGLLPYGSYIGFNTSVWVNIGGGMWQRGAVGPLFFDSSSIPASDHDRILAWMPGTALADAPYFGPYDVLDCGMHYVQVPGAPPGLMMPVASKAIIRRSTDANTPANLCHNMVVQIVGPDGVEHNGDYFTLTTADPIVVDTTSLTFSVGSFYLPADKYLLLTSSMMTQKATVPFEAVATATNAETLFTGDSFGITMGELGVDKIPAGPVKFLISAKCDAIPTDGVNTIHALLFRAIAGGGSATVCEGYTAPIWSTGLATYEVIANIPADITVGPGDTLYFAPTFKTTSLVEQVCRLETGSPWVTRIQTTFKLGFASSKHDDLSGRNTVNNHYGTCALTTSGGAIPVPTAKTAIVTVSGATTITEMATAGLEDGVDIDLIFLQACKITNGASPATGNAKFVLDTMPDGTPNDIDWTDPPQAIGRIGVKFLKTALPSSPCFLLMRGPTI